MPAARKSVRKSVSKPVAKAGKPVAKATKPVAKKASKPVAKAAVVKGSAEGAAEKVYTLDGLVARIGQPVTEADVMARVLVSPEELIAQGADIGTDRIDTDCARVYGNMLDFYQKASAAQRQALLGCSLRLIEIAIWAAHHGHELAKQRASALREGAAKQKLRSVDDETLRKEAKARRRQLFAALAGVAAGEHKQMAVLRQDLGTIATPALLSESLVKLVARARKYLASKDPQVRARLLDTQLSEGFLDRTEALAASVKQLGAAARASRERVEVAQDTVDLWDGYNLALLERLLLVFEAGRGVEPTIPSLPLISLRSWWRGYRKEKPAGDQPVPAPAP